MADSTNTKSGWLARSHLLFACGLLSVLPLMSLQAVNLWNRPHFRYFVVAWLLFAIAIALEPRIGFAASIARRRFGMGLTILGLAISLFAAVIVSPNIAHLALIAMATGWVLVWLGIVPVTRLIALSGLLWITWPWPMEFDQKLIRWLHERAASTVSPLLDLISTPNFLSAEKLDLRGNSLELASILGSWDSVFLLWFCAIVFLLVLRRALAVCVVTLLLVPVLRWIQTSVHFLILAWAQEALGADWTVGGAGVSLSIGVFVLSIVFLLMVIQGLTYLMEPLPVEMSQQAVSGFHGLYNRIVLWPDKVLVAGPDSEDTDYFEDDVDSSRPAHGAKRRRPSVRLTMKASDPWRESLQTFWVVPAFLMVAVLGTLGSYASITAKTPKLPEFSEQQVASIGAADTLPAEMHGLRRLTARILPPESTSPTRTHSIIWSYNANEGTALLTLDFPYSGMQARWSAGTAAGWKHKGKPRRLEVDGWPMMEVEMENESKAIAYSLYSAFDGSGNPAVPVESSESDLLRRLTTTVFRIWMKPSTVPPVTYQTQFFIESGMALSSSRKSEFQAVLAEATAAMKLRVTEGKVK